MMDPRVVKVRDGRRAVSTIQGSLAEDTSPLLQASDVEALTTPPPLASNSSIRTYPWRWVVLAIFLLNNAVTNYIWIMSAIVADLMVCYYGITETMLNFTTTSYMMVYCVFVFPSAWFMNRYGLRLPVVLASAVAALGAGIRVLGTGKYHAPFLPPLAPVVYCMLAVRASLVALESQQKTCGSWSNKLIFKPHEITEPPAHCSNTSQHINNKVPTYVCLIMISKLENFWCSKLVQL